MSNVKEETILQNDIRLAVSHYGIVIRHNVGKFRTADGRVITIGIPGMSDLQYIGPGYIAWLEVKVGDNQPTQEQLNFIAQMRALGHRAGVVRSVEEALDLIRGPKDDRCNIN